MSVVNRKDGNRSVDSGIGTTVIQGKVRRGSMDSGTLSSAPLKTVRKSSTDSGIGMSVKQKKVRVDNADSETVTSVAHKAVGKGSTDVEIKASVISRAGRRASLDYGLGRFTAHNRPRRSSIDIERQRHLQEELAKRKHVQTVKERRHSVQLQLDVTSRLSHGLSRVNLENENVPYQQNRETRKIDECLTKDPNLREDQVKVILQSFSTLDENGDGRISKREIARAYRLAGFNPTKSEIDAIVLEHDDNDDGYIDFEEYFNVMRTKMIKMDFEKERLKTAFKVLDLDADGYISREELSHALSKTGDTFTEQEIKNIIDRADKNLDGKIDYNEFVDAELCKSVF